jgi:hypothetical protein
MYPEITGLMAQCTSVLNGMQLGFRKYSDERFVFHYNREFLRQM